MSPEAGGFAVGYVVGTLLFPILFIVGGVWWSNRLRRGRTDGRRPWWPIIAGVVIALLLLGARTQA